MPKKKRYIAAMIVVLTLFFLLLRHCERKTTATFVQGKTFKRSSARNFSAKD
jgi:hypothetical protein